MLRQEHTKKATYYYVDFQMNAHSFLPLPTRPALYLKEGNKSPKKIGQGEQFLKKSVGETKKGRGEEMQRSQGGWNFFLFIFSLLAIIGTDTVFKKSSLGNLFLKKFPLVLLSIGHIIQTCQVSVLKSDLHLFVSSCTITIT